MPYPSSAAGSITLSDVLSAAIAIAALIVSFLSYWISQRSQKQTGEWRTEDESRRQFSIRLLEAWD